jgi:hypothetical protein
VGTGTDHDDAAAALGQGRAKGSGEREMAEVVSRELELPSLLGPPQIGQHDAGVGDEGVQGPVPVRCEGVDRAPVEEVEASDAAALAGGAEARQGGPSAAGIADRDGDLCPSRGKGSRSGRPDSAGASRNDRAAAGEIDSGQDCGGRRLESELGFGGDGRDVGSLLSLTYK